MWAGEGMEGCVLWLLGIFLWAPSSAMLLQVGSHWVVTLGIQGLDTFPGQRRSLAVNLRSDFQAGCKELS